MPDSTTIRKLLLTAAEAAEALSVSPRTLWTLTQSGQIPSIKIGRLVRYDPEALRRWIEKMGDQAAAAP